MTTTNGTAAERTVTHQSSFYEDGGYEWLAHMRQGGWRPIAEWGAWGWDMGCWPLVCVVGKGSSCAVYVEGDVDTYTFPSVAERDAYLDEVALYHWRQNDAPWLTDGTLDEDLRGQYSAARLAFAAEVPPQA